MKRKLVVMAMITASMVALGAMPASATSARDTSNVFTFSSFETVGTSSLTRKPDSVKMSLSTTRLPAGDAVTVWWVVFNHPENCRTKIDDPGFPFRCGEPDLGRLDVHASVLFAAGHVIGADGTARFGAHLAAGDGRGAIFGSGLDPAQVDQADIHLVVRDHGPKDRALLPGQIRSFDVCNTVCVDVQASVHETT